jgi:hypothetical protein
MRQVTQFKSLGKTGLIHRELGRINATRIVQCLAAGQGLDVFFLAEEVLMKSTIGFSLFLLALLGLAAPANAARILRPWSSRRRPR